MSLHLHINTAICSAIPQPGRYMCPLEPYLTFARRAASAMLMSSAIPPPCTIQLDFIHRYRVKHCIIQSDTRVIYQRFHCNSICFLLIIPPPPRPHPSRAGQGGHLMGTMMSDVTRAIKQLPCVSVAAIDGQQRTPDLPNKTDIEHLQHFRALSSSSSPSPHFFPLIFTV